MSKFLADQLASKKIYLSGPISGRPGLNLETFRCAEEALRGVGIKNVVVPHDLFDNSQDIERTWHDYMRECIKKLMECDVLITLPEWDMSEGSKTEVDLCRRMDIPIHHIYSIVKTFYPVYQKAEL